MFKNNSLIVILWIMFAVPIVTTTAATDLFVSEYVEGSSNNKAIELYNGTGSSIDLLADHYTIEIYFNGDNFPERIMFLEGVVANNEVFVLAHALAAPAILTQAHQTSGGSWFNGDDMIILKKDDTILDVIGQMGIDPGSQWGTGLLTTQDNTLRRQLDICTGDTESTDDFDPALEWEGFEVDTFDGLGTHLTTCSGVDIPPTVANTEPASGATAIATNTNLLIEFSEAVTVTEPWYTIACELGQIPPFTVSTTNSSRYLLSNEDQFTLGDTCTVTVDANQVLDQDVPLENLSTDYSWHFDIVTSIAGCGDSATKIHTIQGDGKTSPERGLIHTIEGVVTKELLADNQQKGFFVQEEESDMDNNPATSEGIFVYNNHIEVNERDIVRVTGKVTEFFGLTELTQIQEILTCSQDAELPAAITILLPVDEGGLERYESMRVTFPQTLTVNSNYNLGRYGEIILSYGRLLTPTQIVTPGAEAQIWQADHDRNQIALDDNSLSSYPDPIIYPNPQLTASHTLRSGDTVTQLSGVLGYNYGKYRLYPSQTPSFNSVNHRMMTPTPVRGKLKIASFNVQNYFNGDGLGGGFPSGRGASTITELFRQRSKLIEAIVTIAADIVGLIEIENDGYGANSAIQDLVNGLNAATTANAYRFINPGLAKLGTDAIAVGLLYRPDTVTPIGPALINNDGAFARKNRPPLVQTFAHLETGEIFTVAINHFKSKGSSCESTGDPDTGDGQGNCNLTRTQAAHELAAWLATDPTGSGDPDFLIIGDLNSYALEDPITALKEQGYTDLIAHFIEDIAYSYVFNGQSGYLDHALASENLIDQISDVTIWHINADEPAVLDYNEEHKSASQLINLYSIDPFRASDHDPVIIGLFPDHCKQLATYSHDSRQAYLPYIEIPLYTNMDGNPIAATGLYSGVLEIPFGFADFAIKELTFLDTIEQSKSCHTKFIPETRMLYIPNLIMPTQVPYLNGKLMPGFEIECSASLQQSVIRPTVFSLTTFECP